ncbi:hypothetical protein [Peribacillus kribbensis]|uniref:hypothetical protein n=1 Tax=Peribacillus kribbensis TaxID=356658 RepID=UPI00047A7D36|nr:hypothetical protein [Peribacillus kribbensis]
MKCKIHRCNCRKTWSIQNRKMKIIAKSILLNGEWVTEVKPDRRLNPKGFVITNSTQDIITDPPAELLRQFKTATKLLYNKNRVEFNINSGKFLWFAENGSCYLLNRLDEV